MEILLNFGEEKNYIFKKNKATEIVQNIEIIEMQNIAKMKIKITGEVKDE